MFGKPCASARSAEQPADRRVAELKGSVRGPRIVGRERNDARSARCSRRASDDFGAEPALQLFSTLNTPVFQLHNCYSLCLSRLFAHFFSLSLFLVFNRLHYSSTVFTFFYFCKTSSISYYCYKMPVLHRFTFKLFFI